MASFNNLKIASIKHRYIIYINYYKNMLLPDINEAKYSVYQINNNNKCKMSHKYVSHDAIGTDDGNTECINIIACQ